jgi:hypothetical protein
MENPPEPPVLLRICPSCNSPIEIDHAYCEICGVKMPELPVCRNCGARFIAPVKFCERCGTPFIPDKNPEAAAEETPEPDDRSESVIPKKSAVTKKEPVNVSSGPDIPGNVDDALFLRSAEPEPVQKKVDTAYLIRGIVLLGIILAAVWFLILPMLTGSGWAGVLNRPASEVTSIPGSPTARSIPPTLMETSVPTPLPDALAPKPTQLVPEGQEVFFLVRKDAVTARITVTLAGGTGIDSISSSEVKVTHPDGAVASGIILPFKGATEIILDGSKETDRVEIITKMTNGRTYRVYDNLVPFQQL